MSKLLGATVADLSPLPPPTAVVHDAPATDAVIDAPAPPPPPPATRRRSWSRLPDPPTGGGGDAPPPPPPLVLKKDVALVLVGLRSVVVSSLPPLSTRLTGRLVAVVVVSSGDGVDVGRGGGRCVGVGVDGCLSGAGLSASLPVGVVI